MTWKHSGPPITDAEIDAFERKTGERMPEGYRWFLKNITNGGCPDPLTYVPIIDGPVGEQQTEGGALFGINHPHRGLNLATLLEQLAEYGTYRGLPIGEDSGGDVFLLIREGPHEGHVRYMGQWEFQSGDTKSYLVAPSMRAFAAVLERQWRKAHRHGR